MLLPVEPPHSLPFSFFIIFISSHCHWHSCISSVLRGWHKWSRTLMSEMEHKSSSKKGGCLFICGWSWDCYMSWLVETHLDRSRKEWRQIRNRGGFKAEVSVNQRTRTRGHTEKLGMHAMFSSASNLVHEKSATICHHYGLNMCNILQRHTGKDTPRWQCCGSLRGDSSKEIVA